jgi:hypothetical protein
MPILARWDLVVDADKVLWGQGANPEVIKKRNPRLADIAQQAVEEGSHLLHPLLLYERIPVIGHKHDSLQLRNGTVLRGSFVRQHLLGSEEITVAVCTVGEELSSYASEVFQSDPVRGLALDGLASAAAEALAEAACQFFDNTALLEGKSTSMPLNPGMEGWPLERGQEQIFSLIQPEKIGVTLNASGIMLPLKSLSLLIGSGEYLEKSGISCDYCTMRETCHYKNQYNEIHQIQEG